MQTMLKSVKTSLVIGAAKYTLPSMSKMQNESAQTL